MLRSSSSRPSRRRGPVATAGLVLLTLGLAACSSTTPDADRSTASPTPTPTVSSAPSSSTARSSDVPRRARSAMSGGESGSVTMPPAPSRTSARAASRAGGLPLDLATGDATQVVTVVSDGPGDTTASVRRWTRASGGWRSVGPAVDAYVGAGGIGRASEGSTRTPAGSWTITQAFGRDSDPGTALPYFRTTPDDYWMSSPGSRYNTHQRCGSCGYDNGVNERLHDITPEYDYAAVIDYNTRNAPGGVRPGAGSAFFLHIADGAPTAGCVAVPRADLVRILTWLRPADRPRILIGTG